VCFFAERFSALKQFELGELGRVFSGDEEHELCECVRRPCWITTCVMCV
jgi:hypothetical protein